ncbi:MAG: hypothetical protein EHM45_04920 [Desulfobacteraceae bacterium]|nr:MAG: hypothetical protein EHM45_04920 [Desulfobacteraceae bacterium]
MLLLAPIDLRDDQRMEIRIQVPDIQFLFAIFKLADSPDNQDYELPVVNYSPHGLGLLISENEYSLAPRLCSGYEIKGIRLYAESALTLVDGIVRHVTRIEEGEYSGHFLLGIESATALRFER